jgi:hypothetical protein
MEQVARVVSGLTGSVIALARAMAFDYSVDVCF